MLLFLPAVHAGRLAESQGFPSYYSHLNTMWTTAFGQAATKTFYPPTGMPPSIYPTFHRLNHQKNSRCHMLSDEVIIFPGFVAI
jgi:hypothetical protein